MGEWIAELEGRHRQPIVGSGPDGRGIARRHLESNARWPATVPVDSAQSFPELEQEVLERWRERDVFHESIRRREGAPPFVFYEGPPTANGRPGSHHVLSRVFKDVFPRYRTMTGHFVPRKGGWDCHGLPVELEIEKELGFTNKHDIERYGIAEFNAKCRESVLRYIDEWNELTERIGFWIDTDDAYYTLRTTTSNRSGGRSSRSSTRGS